jgi:hypothetical protein
LGFIFCRRAAVLPEMARFFNVRWGSLFSRKAAVLPETARFFRVSWVLFFAAGQQYCRKRPGFSE